MRLKKEQKNNNLHISPIRYFNLPTGSAPDVDLLLFDEFDFLPKPNNFDDFVDELCFGDNAGTLEFCGNGDEPNEPLLSLLLFVNRENFGFLSVSSLE